MEDYTIGLLAIGVMITGIVIAGLVCGHDGTLILSGVGSLSTIFGIFIEKQRQRRK